MSKPLTMKETGRPLPYLALKVENVTVLEEILDRKHQMK